MSETASAVPGRDDTIVIVGAGIAGVRAALTLREAGFEGHIKLLSDEANAPYDRPPLSKAVLIDPEGEKNIGLDPDAQLAAKGVELMTSARCVSIDREGRAIHLDSGAIIPYQRLILATGSSVRQLDIFPYGAPRVHYLRYLQDALNLREAVRLPCRLAIVGAGVIGLEVAASLVSQGHKVTVVDPADRVMGRSASEPLGQYLTRRHLAEGVDLRLSASITSVSQENDELRLTLADGGELFVDHVIVGVGVMPNYELAQACGLEVQSSGIVVDERGCSSDPAIYAAGEVAFYMNADLGRHDRQETWAHAVAHGEHVARAIMGVDDAYRERASYWTDQYDINVQVLGEPIGEQNIVRGDLDGSGGLIFHLRGQKITGVTAVNAVRQLRAARKILGATVTEPNMLADETVSLDVVV